MTAQKPATQPAPNPLPALWARLLANAIHKELTTTGWQTAKQLREWHPSGSPRTASHSTSRGVPKTESLSNTDILNIDIYAWGIIDPETTKLPTPPLAWSIRQLQFVSSLTTDQGKEVDHWQHLHKHAPAPALFTPQLNRHGVLTLRRNAHAAIPETIAAAFTKAAQAATVLILDPADLDAAYAEVTTITLQNVTNALQGV